VSCVAACAHRMRGTQRSGVASRTAPPDATVWRSRRRAAAAVAATVLSFAVLFAVSARQEAFGEADWAVSAAGRLSPYGATVAEGAVSFGRDTAQALSWGQAWAALPLTVLVLFWLARRDQALYVRFAIVLLLSGTAGLGAFAVMQSWPVREELLLRDYLAFPGAQAGWYSLMALAVVAASPRIWPRVTVLLLALSTATLAVSTADRAWLAVLLAAAVPLMTWYATGRPWDRKGGQQRAAVDTAPVMTSQRLVVPFRSRSQTPGPQPDPELLPLRQAG
jgi:hypothetical protein